MTKRPTRKNARSRRGRSQTRQTDRQLEFHDIGDLENNRSWLFYGRSNSGKTTLAGSFPKPLLLVDFRDKGTDSINDLKGIRVMQVTEADEVEDLYWYLKQNPKEFATVVFDTTTGWQQLLVEETSGKKAEKMNKAPGDWGTMTKSEWGDIAAKMKTDITRFRDLPMNVVFLAQDRVFNIDEEEGEVGEIDPEVGPALSPSVKSHLCAAVSVIGNTFIHHRTSKRKVNGKPKEVVEYCVRLGPSASYITKIRKPKSIILPEFVVDPTYEDILEIIEGE